MEVAEQPLVISHYPCLDGFTAAWAVWLKYPEAEFHKGVYGEPPPNVEGRDVIIVDFSYKRDVMAEIIKKCKTIVLLDHHKTAEHDLANLWDVTCTKPINDVFIGFDMRFSGAQLAWHYFHNMNPPKLVNYVADRDLWKFELWESRAINAALFSYAQTFERWSELSAEMEKSSIDGPIGLNRFVTEGAALERKHHKDIKEIIKLTMRLREFSLGYWGKQPKVPVANMPYTMASDAANLMAENYPFAATYYVNSAGKLVFSLRSREYGADVSEIAAMYGGGGHKHAAGFTISSLEEL